MHFEPSTSAVREAVRPAVRSRLAQRALRVLRYAWASPVTLVGLLAGAALMLRGAAVRVVDGVVEVTGGSAANLPGRRFCAITLGHVVLARSAQVADACRVHERAHVRQYECLGPLMPVLYAASSAWVALRGGSAYFDNAFERHARDAERRALGVPHSG